MKKILFAAFAALSMIACNKDDATTIIPDIDNTLNGAIVAMPKWAGNPIVVSIICGIVLFRLCIVGRLFFRHVHGCRLVCFVVLGIDRANTICTAAACCFGSVFGIFFVFRFVTAGALVVIRAAALRQVVTIACGFQSLVVCLFQCVNSCSGSCGSCCNHCSDNRSFHIDTSFLRHHVLCRRVRKCTRCGSSAGRRQKTQTFPDYSFHFAVIFLHL
mgnify:CR=1 FL=1